MNPISSLTAMAGNFWNYFSMQPEPLWKQAMDEAGYREYLAFESSVRSNLKPVEEHISNKTILPQTLRTILLKQQERQLERFISPYFYDKKLKRLQDKLDCPKAFIDVIEESRVRLKEKLAKNPLIAKQSFYNEVINHLIKLSANLDLHVINADNLADIMQYYQGIIPAEIFDPIKVAIENTPITDQKNIEVVLKTVNEFFFEQKAETKDDSSFISKGVDQFRSRSANLKKLAAALAWSYVGAGMGVRAQGMGGEFLKVLGLNTSNIYANAMAMNSAGEIFVAGSTLTFGSTFTGSKALLIKFYVNGTEAWSRTFGDTGLDVINAMIITPEDEILMTGSGYYQALVIKYFDNSTIAWATALGGSVDYRCNDIITTPDATMILVTGETAFGVGGSSSFVASLFNNGTLNSIVAVDGPGGEVGYKIATNAEGEKFLLGSTGGGDVLLTKISVNNIHVWTTLFGGIEYPDYAIDFTITSTGKILVVGTTFSSGAGSFASFIASFSPTDGALEWIRTIGGVNYDAKAITINTQGVILVLGYIGENKMILANFFENGTISWARTIEGGSPDSMTYGLLTNSMKQILIACTTYNAEILPQNGILLSTLNAKGDIPGCNLTHSYRPTVMDWQNATVSNVTSAMNIFPLNFSSTDLSNITFQSITLEEFFSCQSNSSVPNSTATLSNTTPASSVPSSSQNSQTTTITTSSSSSTNSTSSRTSQASNTINFTVQVSPEIILIDGETYVLSSADLSVLGNVNPSDVIWTVNGNLPDWIDVIYVNGVASTSFSQQDVEENFVSIQLNGVECENEYALSLEATVEGTDVRVDADLIFEMDTCSTTNAPRLRDGFLISSKMLPSIGMWARTTEQPTRSLWCSEAELGKGFPGFR